MTFQVLFVCTGNICRSPMAERLMRARANSSMLEVSSAGTHALVGYGMDTLSAQVLRELGGDPDGHVARRLVKDMVTRADLVLTASAEQRAQVLGHAPAAMRKVFTLREFARLGAAVPEFAAAISRPSPVPPPARLAQRVAEIAGQRGGGGVAAGGDDIGDPFGAPMPEVQRVGRQISDAVSSALQSLGFTA